MKLKQVWLGCGMVLLLQQGAAAAVGQVNIAALAQFKQNQQQELARQLQASANAQQPSQQATKQASRKHGKHGKAMADVPPNPARPALIKANNRQFKGNYTDMRKTNMR